ncbi:MAG: pilus assembly PilX N-terminal domain-containing protein [Geopsychrobacter sp.]|nr:pilus assembly PilX N-terminal domain-containing protein [Geopsychrobacter sp.]
MSQPYGKTFFQCRALRPATRTLGNQQGMALIVTLGILAVLSVLGALLLNTTTTEIKISRNYLDSQQAMYVAERAVEYAYERATNIAGDVDLINDNDGSGNPHVDSIAIDIDGDGTADASLEANPPVGTAGHDPDKNRLRFVGAGPPPTGSGSDASKFKANYYVVRATGVYPLAVANPARSTIIAEAGRVVPK